MSTHSSSNTKKRIILKNPDGTFSYLYKEGEIDSVFEKKEKMNNEINENQINLNNLSLSDEELQYLIDHADNFDYYTLIEQILEIFRSYRILFFMTLILELFLTTSLLYSSFKNKETAIYLMQEIYKDMNADEANFFFNVSFISLLLINLIYYPIGLYGILYKKVKHLKIFSSISLYSAIACIFIFYINIMFIFVFILRLILYGFSKFVINLLISIILLPNRHPQVMRQGVQNGRNERIEINYGTV